MSAHAGVVTHLDFVNVNRKYVATMGMEKAGWRANLPKVGWKLVILEENKRHRGVVVNVFRAGRPFLLVERASSQPGRSMSSGRKGGEGVWKSEVIGIECKVYVLLATVHVRVVRWVQMGGRTGSPCLRDWEGRMGTT